MTATNDATTATYDLAELIASLYRETLNDATLGVRSEFLDAGGDSMAAFEISTRLHETTGLEVPVAFVFVYPSPAELADVVSAQG